MTTPLDLLDEPSSIIDTSIDRAADELVDREDVSCPCCGHGGSDQIPVFVGRDGAFDRIDFMCSQCGTEHPIWIG